MEEKAAKAAGSEGAAVQVLKEKLQALRPDALVIFGDDQSENFSDTFVNIPSIAVYVGEEFAGRRYNGERGEGLKSVPGHPALATSILTGLLDNGFDPAFCMGLPNPERGIGHAIMNPLGYFTDYTIPTVPILLNALFAPQVTGKRANQLGNAVRTQIERYPEDIRVLVIGSGGLWHTTSHGYNTYLNEEFDQLGLKHLAAGDIKGWANHFDSYKVPDGDMSQYIGERRNDMTGMPSLAGPFRDPGGRCCGHGDRRSPKGTRSPSSTMCRSTPHRSAAPERTATRSTNETSSPEHPCSTAESVPAGLRVLLQANRAADR